MPTDPIVARIDEELTRHRQIRSILQPLLSLPNLPKRKRTLSGQVREAVPEPAVTPVPSPEVPVPPVTRLPPRKVRARDVRVLQPEPQPTALKGAVPRAPVVVRPNTSKTAEPVSASLAAVAPGSFAALVRAAEQELHAG